MPFQTLSENITLSSRGLFFFYHVLVTKVFKNVSHKKGKN